MGSYAYYTRPIYSPFTLNSIHKNHNNPSEEAPVY